MRTLLAFVLGIILGAVGVAAALWYYSLSQSRSAAAAAQPQVESHPTSTRGTLEEKLRALNLTPQAVKDELARTGQVVRRKAQAAGNALADATADARITTTIKGKLLVSRDLSPQNISVSTANCVVVLSGAVSSPNDISKAMMLAMDTDGVREVVSKLQVKPAAGPS